MKRLLCFVTAVILTGYGWCYFEKEGIHADAIPTPHEYRVFVQEKTASAVELVTEIIQAMD